MLALLAPLCLQYAATDASAIRTEDMRARIAFLASDAMEGRESGERGGHLAALFFAQEWHRLELEPLGAPFEDGPEEEALAPFILPFEAAGRTCWNTAALLPGTDPDLKYQVIVVGGHHDHAGIGGPGAMGYPGEIHNGADDNASGSAGVAELAEWFVAHPTRHPILFMTFSAEERGLLGSKDFVQNGPLPPEHMLAMLNFDMIGRAEGKLFVGGTGTAKEFPKLLKKPLRASKLKIETGEGGHAPSDNSSFFDAGVPALFLFTNVHEDYHMPGDDVEKIDFKGTQQVLELGRSIIEALDKRDDPLTFKNDPRMAMPKDFQKLMAKHYRMIGERNRQRGRLGLYVGDPLEGQAGLAVTKLSEKGGSKRAGVLVGDQLLQAADRIIETDIDLIRALGSGQKGETITLLLLRDGVKIELVVTLR